MDDLAAPQHHRSGAHRARRHPLLVLLLTLGAVGVASALLLWALLSFDGLGVSDDLLQAGGDPSVPATDGSAEPSAAVTGAAEPSGPPASEPAGGSTDEPGEEPSEEPEPVVDRDLPLDVLNSTATPGLAASAAEQLEALGWSVGEVTNYDGDETPTTVLFPEESQEATAEAVAEELGTGSAQQSDDVEVLTVVLGPDYDG